MRKIFPLLFIVVILFTLVHPAFAQESGPIYIVQSGDTLTSIASRFKISVDALMTANEITDPNLVAAGQQLTMPGFGSITGVLDTKYVKLGDSLRSVSRQNQISIDTLQVLNHLTSPSELYISANLIVLEQDENKILTASSALAQGQSLLEMAVLQGSDTWTLSSLNNLNSTWDALPGDILYSQNSELGQAASGLPSAFVQADIPSLPLIQGGTAEIKVTTTPGTVISGTLVDRPLSFFQTDNNAQVALQGIYAMLAPGLYPLSLVATLPDGTTQSFEQLVIIQSGNYPTDPILSVSADTIDPTTNDDETKQLIQLTSPVTATRYWQGQFTNPSPEFPDCHPSYFGNRRNYVASGTSDTYNSFHSGLDFCGHVGSQIVAAANGVVVFTGMLTVHGNTTIIDHGWGIYSIYCHQSQIDVNVGDQVQAGNLIGLVGETGRITGPHLHFEIWANGVQVDPLDWLNQSYP